MLHEYRDVITHMKENEAANAHFLKIFDRHNDLDNQITRAEHGSIALTSIEIEKMKKEKLHLKDEAYNMIIAYKKEHNL
jgi:uncharacterized protein YdcH (DUF465 family)